MPAVDDVLDGYRLIRMIGSGGFGDVWLCRMESTGEYRALKFLPQSRVRHLDRELEALKVYRREIGRDSARHLVAIEHINRSEEGLFYVMPLADGPPGLDCEAEDWKPVTLATLSENRRSAASWFSAEEVTSIFAPLVMAAQTLAEAGLVHRDIKPQNILFFGGEPRLADIGLVSEDEAVLSQMGTPGYAAPQWYLASQGSPDMWGLAATLYHFATGNHPDYMSRPAYRWPPGGKQGLTASDQKAWLALIGIVYRATQESPAERYLQFRDMATALNELLPNQRGKIVGRPSWSTRRVVTVGLAAVAMIFVVSGLLKIWPRSSAPSTPTPKATPKVQQPATALVPTPTPKATPKVQQPATALVPTRKPDAKPKVQQPAMTPVSTQKPEVQQEPQQPVPFEKQVETATSDFESLLKSSRHALLGDRPMSHDPVDTFEKLVNTLKTKEGAPMAELRNIYTKLEALEPAFTQELHLINTHKIDQVVDELKAAAVRPKQLASNPDEVLRAGKVSDRLLAEVSELQDEATKQNIWVSYKVDTLQENLRNATMAMSVARLKDRKAGLDTSVANAESSEIYGLSETVISKVLRPVLHSDQAH